MKKWTPEQEQLAKNHIPTVKRCCDSFLHAFDAEGVNDKEKTSFLIAICKSMKKDIKEVIDMLELIN